MVYIVDTLNIYFYLLRKHCYAIEANLSFAGKANGNKIVYMKSKFSTLKKTLFCYVTQQNARHDITGKETWVKSCTKAQLNTNTFFLNSENIIRFFKL